MRVMLDLEALGVNPGCVILSIGAVAFTDKIESTFYELVDIQSCLDLGMGVEGSTLKWWMDQCDEARAEFQKPASNIREVLLDFSNWFPEGAEVWGNGATADNVWLTDAYRRCGIERPWGFRQDRCYRTLKSLRPEIEIEVNGTHHNALDDARNQALHLLRLLA